MTSRAPSDCAFHSPAFASVPRKHPCRMCRQFRRSARLYRTDHPAYLQAAFGNDARFLLPCSALLGGSFVLLCDLLGRILFSPFELPAGIIMSFVGGPFFLYLLLKRKEGAESMLEFRNVSVSCQHTPILNDISLTFRDGEITTILGPNGCGKTTLVQCLNGASTVTAGQIFLNGQDFLKISPKERAWKFPCSHRSARSFLLFRLKCLWNTGAFPYLGFSRRKSKEDTEIVNRAMEFTHISQYADQYVDTLSGGIRQRVFLPWC